MKKLIPAIALLGCALLFTACATTKEEVIVVPEVQPQSAAETPVAAPEPTEPAAAESEPAEPAEQPATGGTTDTTEGTTEGTTDDTTGGTPSEGASSMTGTIDQLTDTTMMMSDATGVDYLFNIAGIEVTNGPLAEGDRVTIEFKGTIEPTDQLQAVTITSIVKG